MAESVERKNNTLVNVTNFGVNMTDDRLRKMFEKYGTISSCGIMNDDEPWRRFAYVAFEDSDAADEAVIELNGQLIDDNRRIKVKRTRKREKRTKPTSWSGKGCLIKNREPAVGASNDVPGGLNVVEAPVNSEGWSPINGFGVYIQNLDPAIDRFQLIEIFKVYGVLREVKIIMHQENGVVKSRGFAFVTFFDEKPARRAIAEMDGRQIGRNVVRLAISRGKKKPLNAPNNLQRSFSHTYLHPDRSDFSDEDSYC